MPSREEVAYFGAGPAPLPTSILEKGAQAFLNFENSGLSLAEISHRSKTAESVLSDTRNALIELLDIPNDYEVLFMHGGGSGQFSAVVFNMVAFWVEKRRRQAMADLDGDTIKVLERVRREVRNDLKLDYLVTGSWSLKASQEAANLLAPLGGKPVNVAVDARKNGEFGDIPKEEAWSLTPHGAALVYYCDNETVDGVELPAMPQCLQGNDCVVADMSSNFLSRPVDVNKYAVIFGGAQKRYILFHEAANRITDFGTPIDVGITGVTLVIVRKDVLDPINTAFLHSVGVSSPPAVFDYRNVSKSSSLYNTMPIFDIWIAGKVIRGLLEEHGDQKLVGQEKLSNSKAKLIYDILDAHPETYQVVPQKNVRSRMNVCFRVRTGDADSEKEFLQGAERRLLEGLKGHRSVGGVRFSNYNAVTVDNVQRLAKYLQEFADQQSRQMNGSS